ncbi:DNA-binding protein RFX7 [Caerostris extrusa]|uniref:DNA-binding protein RFX7 n=1 Tax=Caerostris extrusa TaxID=172846 RepID=A0AAV4NTJ4_CAEEX|nr:DNA-binding protein RFX7 [Caerostris extrusa]
MLLYIPYLFSSTELIAKWLELILFVQLTLVKVMKQIFPSVKPRRLGTRGNSRYCYSGLQKKLQLKSPSLPDMHAEVENSETHENTRMDETTSAACHVVFQWAEKLLGLKFASLKNLASHLLENMYVDNRSVAAVTVLLEGPPELLEKGFASCEGSAKKSGAQIHLHRKIQEKELIKEQKKKLQEQRSSLSISNKTKEDDTFEIKEEEFDAESVSLISNKSTVESDTLPQQLSSEKKISPHTSPGISLEIDDNVKRRLSETGKQSNTSKYKRIQPKPLKDENSFSAGMRVRAGSVGSSTAIKPKSKFNDGRRSSHAWLQSSFSPENSEDIIQKS